MGTYWYYPQRVHLPCLPMQHQAHAERAHLGSQGSFLLWSWVMLLSRGSTFPYATQHHRWAFQGSSPERWHTRTAVTTKTFASPCTLCRSGPFHTLTTTRAPGTGTKLSPPRKQPTAGAAPAPRGKQGPAAPPALSAPAGLAPAPPLRNTRRSDWPGRRGPLWRRSGDVTSAAGADGRLPRKMAHGSPCLRANALPPVTLPHVEKPPTSFRPESV